MAHKILSAVDGTKHSEHAIEFAAELASKLGSDLTIASVNVLVSGGRGPMIYAKEDDVVESAISNSTRLRAGRTQNTDQIDRSYYLQHDTADSQGIGAPASSSAWPPVATTTPCS